MKQLPTAIIVALGLYFMLTVGNGVKPEEMKSHYNIEIFKNPEFNSILPNNP